MFLGIYELCYKSSSTKCQFISAYKKLRVKILPNKCLHAKAKSLNPPNTNVSMYLPAMRPSILFIGYSVAFGRSVHYWRPMMR